MEMNILCMRGWGLQTLKIHPPTWLLPYLYQRSGIRLLFEHLTFPLLADLVAVLSVHAVGTFTAVGLLLAGLTDPAWLAFLPLHS